MRCSYATDFPDRLRERKRYILTDPKTHEVKLVSVAELRLSQDYFLVRFHEITTPEEARRFNGWFLEVDARRVPDDTAEGEFYYFQLVGLAAMVEGWGRAIGTVTGVIPGKAYEILAIDTPEGEELLIPFVTDFVAEVQLAEGRLVLKRQR